MKILLTIWVAFLSLSCIAASPTFVNFQTTNSIFVSKSGNNTTGAKGNSATPFLTLSAAKAVASSGDTIILSAGTFTESTTVQLPKNVNLVGAGRGVTFLVNNANGPGTVCLGPGDNSSVANLTVQCTNFTVAQVPFGITSSQSLATNFTVFNCDIIGNEDGGFFENSSNKITGRLISCAFKTKWDGMTTLLLDTNSIIDLFDCRLEVVPQVIGGNAGEQAHGIQNMGGLVRLWGCSVVTTNGPVATDEYGIGEVDAGNPLSTEVHTTSVTIGPAAAAIYYSGDTVIVWGAENSTLFNGTVTFHGGAPTIASSTLVAGAKTVLNAAIKTTSTITPVRKSTGGTTATLNCEAPSAGSVIVRSSNGSDTADFQLIIVNP